MSNWHDYTTNLSLSIFITWTLFDKEKSQTEYKESSTRRKVWRDREGCEKAKTESLKLDMEEVGTSAVPKMDDLWR